MSVAHPWLLLLIPPVVALVIYLVVRKDWFAARQWRTGFLYSLAAAVLVAAMAQPAVLVERGAAPTVVFIADASPSMQFAQPWQQAAQWVRRSLPGGTELALVAFSGSSQVTFPPGQTLPTALASPASAPGTDIQRAIRWATAIAPADPARTALVLYSDGWQTQGDALAAALEARRLGYRLYTIAPAKAMPADAAIVGFAWRGPRDADVVPVGAKGNLEVTLRTNRDGPARLTVEMGSGTPKTFDAELRAGEDRVVAVPTTFAEPGLRTVRASVTMAEDAVAEDDAWSLALQVGRRRPVLVVRGGDGDEGASAPIPLPEDVPHARVAAADMPTSAAELSPYAAVVLNNVPAYGLSPQAMDALVRYVRDTGGGLVALGGPRAFALGGYPGTALDDMLPVKSDPDDRPPVRLVVLLDHSASMARDVSGNNKLALAKDALLQVASLLSARDRVTVIAFNTRYDFLATELATDQWSTLQAALAPLRPESGTVIGPPLEAAIDLLARAARQSPGVTASDELPPRYHIIAITDGQVVDPEAPAGQLPFDVEALARRATADGVSVSLVLTGEAESWPGLAELAERTGGRFYDIASGVTTAAGGNRLERVFAEDLSRSLLRTTAAKVKLVEAAPLLPRGTELEFGAVPSYIVTQAKPRAAVALAAMGDPEAKDSWTRADRPLLATWYYGLGRTAAWPVPWTSEAAPWLAQASVRRLALAALEWTSAGPGLGAEYDVKLSADGGQLFAEVRARSLSNGLAAVPRVAIKLSPPPAGGPDAADEFDLEPVGPGHWRLETTVPAGAYACTVLAESAGEDGAGSGMIARATLSTGPSAEYRHLADDNMAMLERVAQLGGGTMLPSPEAARDVMLAGATASALWPWLVGLAVCAVLYDTGRTLLGRRREREE